MDKVKAKVFLGIDIGKSGALVIVKDGKIVWKTAMPKIGKKEVDVTRLRQIIWGVRKNYKVVAVFEALAVGKRAVGQSQIFGLGFQAGLIEGIVSGAGIPYHKVHPKTWQKEMWAGVQKVEDITGKTDTKSTSLIAAKRIWPLETFLATKLSRVPHDGVVDASLLAEYGRRKGLI